MHVELSFCGQPTTMEDSCADHRFSKMVQHFRFTSIPTRLVDILEDPLAPCHDGQEVTAEQKEGATAEDRRYGCYTQLARHLRVSIPALSIYLAHAKATGLAAGHRPLRLVLGFFRVFRDRHSRQAHQRDMSLWKCFPVDPSVRTFVFFDILSLRLFALLLSFQSRGVGKTRKRRNPKYTWPDEVLRLVRAYWAGHDRRRRRQPPQDVSISFSFVAP